MFRSILSTISTRLLTALAGFAVVIYVANRLGPEGNGTVSLIVLAISINLIISNIVTSGMIFLIPRAGLSPLIAPAVIWSVIGSVFTSLILNTLSLIPEAFLYHVILLSVLQSWITIIQSILLGKQKIGKVNIVTVIQSLGLLMALLVLFGIWQINKVDSYVAGLYISYGLAVVTGFIFCYGISGRITFRGILPSFLKLSRYGGFAQGAAVIQILNYRLGYYLVEILAGRAALGIFSVGTQLSEGMLIPAKSVAMVQYSAIANSREKEYPARLTLTLAKLILALTLMLELVLVLLPESFYTFLFSRSFEGVKPVILFLAPGILMLALSNILTHYFSGTGKHHQNTIASAAGFVVMVAVIYPLTNRYGLEGAAIATSLAYTGSVIYQLLQFGRLSGTHYRQFLPGSEDKQVMQELFKKLQETLTKRKKN